MEMLDYIINSLLLSTLKAFSIFEITVKIHSLPITSKDSTLERKGVKDGERLRKGKWLPPNYSNHNPKIHLRYLLVPHCPPYITLATKTFQVCLRNTYSPSLPLLFYFNHYFPCPLLLTKLCLIKIHLFWF